MHELLLSEDQIREACQRLGEILIDYEASLEERAVLGKLDRGALREILDEPWPEHGRPIGDRPLRSSPRCSGVRNRSGSAADP